MSASATRDDWLAAVAKALKSDPDAALDRLRSTTYDGIVIEPLYTADDALEPAAVVRGSRRGGWDVRQLVDAAAGPGRAVDELERGATSILLDLTGVAEITADGVSAALDGVLLDVAPVVLHAGTRWREAADAFTPPAGMHGLGADPIGEAAVHPSAFDLDEHLTALAGWFDRNESLRPITVDATRYHDAGASDAEQLGCAIAVLVDYLRALGEHGVDPDTVLRRSELRLAATADQFATIASIRAVRRLCARVGEVVGAPAGVPPVHAVTSRAMMTRYDPWVNALRSTVACFAAGVAGADAVTVLPHDGLLGAAELGRRVARNTQSILVAESHLAEVVDPAGGSWYVERFTDQLAEAAWSWFQEIERAGGFRRAAADGLVAERIAATAAARRARHRQAQGAADRPQRVPQRRRGDAATRARAGERRRPRPASLGGGIRGAARPGRPGDHVAGFAAVGVPGDDRPGRRIHATRRVRREPLRHRRAGMHPGGGSGLRRFGIDGRLHLLERRPLRRTRRRRRRPARGGRGERRLPRRQAPGRHRPDDPRRHRRPGRARPTCST